MLAEFQKLSTFEVAVMIFFVAILAIGIAVVVLGVSSWMFNVSFRMGEISSSVGKVDEKVDGQRDWTKTLDIGQKDLDRRVTRLEVNQE